MYGTSDPVAQHQATLERLRERKRWSTDLATVRFAALALGGAGDRVDLDRLEAAAEALRGRAGWTSPLRSGVRYVAAAMIVREGLDADVVHERIVETRAGFKAHRVPRRQPGATFAALVLVLRAGGGPVPEGRLERLGAIYRRWRSDHFWLTDANDLPAAALHAGGDRQVEMLAADVERTYARLLEAGFRRGSPLQLVSHLLAVDARGVETGVERFRRIAERLQRLDRRVRPDRYDEVALLALTHGDAATVVERVLDYRDRLREGKPRPAKALAFTLAAGIAFAWDAEHSIDRAAGDLAALHAIQAIITARRVALATAVGAGAAAGQS